MKIFTEESQNGWICFDESFEAATDSEARIGRGETVQDAIFAYWEIGEERLAWADINKVKANYSDLLQR